MSNLSDFYIKDKMLLKYHGADDHVVIPETVTTIRSGAFFLIKTRVKSIDISDNVTHIVSGAFDYCNMVKCIRIGKKVKKIAENFEFCSSLSNIYVDENNPYFKSIDGNLYTKDGKTLLRYVRGKRAKSFNVPEHVTKIARYAFSKCNSLRHITIPENVFDIDVGAFHGCRNLSSISLPKYLKQISCAMFYDCVKLTDFTIPNSVEKIGAQAFENLDSLANINIPESVHEIAIETHCGVGISGKNLSTISVDEQNAFFKSINGNLYNKDGATLIRYAVGIKSNRFEIPEHVTKIQKNAFSKAKNLEKITIPFTVSEIEQGSFQMCTSLTCITLPERIKSIEDFVFSGCNALKEVIIPSNVAEIGVGAFGECISLTKVLLPDKISKISNSAFSGCIGLKEMVIPSSVSEIGSHVFCGCKNLVIKGKTGSYAERYAKENEIPFEEIEE